MGSVTIIGIIGLFILLGGFILNLTGRMNAESTSYLLLNIAGCMLLTFYAVALEGIPFMILEGVWGLSSLVKLLLLLWQRREKDVHSRE